MSDTELRMQCLHLASQQGLPDVASIIAAASQLYAFATNAVPSEPKPYRVAA